MNKEKIQFDFATIHDLEKLEEIRRLAFQPIFDSFRSILGDTIYETAQMHEDFNQREVLRSYFDSNSEWEILSIKMNSEIIGFISIRLDWRYEIGEIGLNAINPKFTGRGIGTRSYSFALALMKKIGMKVATVATGGDPSHFPARKAYRKAGFRVEIPSVWMCQELH